MQPFVERSLAASVKKNPQPFVDVLSPVLLPAVKQTISQALREMVQSLNAILEQTMSARGLRWRVEAWRTGKPFGEIALARSLVFRVEVVQLIHRETGLLLSQVSAPGVELPNPQVVAAVSTAVQDFVHESFGVREAMAGQLRSMHVGDRMVWIEAGHLASIVGIIRGHPPESLRHQFHATLTHIEREARLPLRGFTGDTKPFEPYDLTDCLVEQLRPRPTPWRAYVVLLIAGAAFLAWAILAVTQARRAARFVDLLEHTPGVVVTGTERAGGHYVVHGLRDAYSADPAALAARAKLDPRKVDRDMVPFISLQPTVLADRLRAMLRPPPGVRIFADGDHVVMTGHAPRAWIESARARRAELDGMLGWEERGLVEDEMEEMRALATKLAERSVRFRTDSARIEPSERATIEAAAREARRLDELGEATQRTPVVVVTGHADRPGPAPWNRALSRARADQVRSALTAQGVNPQQLAIVGVGTAGSERHVDFEVRM
jgi:OOP family OmpA-OmpF porin